MSVTGGKVHFANVMEGKVLSGRYVIKKKIAKGGFSNVFLGEDLRNGRRVAIKIEDSTRRVGRGSYLRYEYEVLKILRGGYGIPDVYFYHEEENEKMLVMECLGFAVGSALSKCKRFSLKTVLMLIEQMLTCLEYVHNKGILHRDLKPGNFLVGEGKNANRIYLVDFGLSRQVRSETSPEFNRTCITSNFEGTSNFAPTAAHDGFDQFRSDELQSLMYVIVYMLKGKLPWSDMPLENGETKNKLIGQRKKEVSVWELCDGLPVEFRQFFTAIQAIKPFERPDYSGYRELFRQLFISRGFVYDYDFDWRRLMQLPAPVADASKIEPLDLDPVETHEKQLMKPLPVWMRKHGNK